MTETANIHGTCAPFCLQAVLGEVPRRGAPLDDHGDWCVSRLYRASATTLGGASSIVFVNAARRYKHGEYTRDELAALEKNSSGVHLCLEGPGGERIVMLSGGEARELAARLTRCADILAEIDQPHQRLEWP